MPYPLSVSRLSARTLFIVGALLCAVFSALAQTPQFGVPVTINADQSITYHPTPKGDRIPDFSTVGYNYGNSPLPDAPGGYQVPVLVTLSPGTGDQTDRIQAALDWLSTRPLVNGFRGALLLKAGRWDIHSLNRLTVRASGVVIRGEGDHPLTGTRLYALGTINENNPAGTLPGANLLRFLGNSNTVNANARTLVDAVYIPSGTNVIPISGHPFTVGQRIQVRWPGSVAWQKASLFKTDATADLDPAVTHNRVITAVTPHSITLDAPITTPLDPAWGRGYVVPVTAFNHITHVGVSNIYFESAFAHDADETHATNAVSFSNVEDGFMHNCTARHFAFAAANVGTTTRKITIDRTQGLDAISRPVGARRYTFLLSGELGLVSNSVSRFGRHSFVSSWPGIPGPIAFVDSVALNSHNESGAHLDWNNGGLWDNITDNTLQVKLERPAASSVAWNCILNTLTFENMPFQPNWALGNTTSSGGAPVWRNSVSGGAYAYTAPHLGKAELWSHGTRMPVRSLYEHQLHTRLAAAGNPHRYAANLATLVPLPPTLRTPAQLIALSGSAFSYQVPASNLVPSVRLPNFTASGLPPGLSINSSTGLVSGTLPTVVSETHYAVTFSARNIDGTATRSLTLTVRPPGSPKIPLAMGLEVDTARTTTIAVRSGQSAQPVPMVPSSRLLAPMIVRKAYLSDVDGSAYTATDIPVPVRAVLPFEGLTSPVTVTYNGSTTLPTAPGFYDVVATLDDPIYSATATGRLLITTATAVTVTLGNTSAPTAANPVTATYSVSGVSPQPVLTPVLTYDGAPDFPTAPGFYAAKAVVADPTYFGSRLALIGIAPQITQQPASLTVVQGSPATFSVAASGLAPTYQWRKNGTPIPGATSATFSLASTQGSDSATYDVLVTDQSGVTPSAPAALVVVVPPQISQPPASVSVAVNTPATFTVSATGGALSYQWRRGSTPLPGATSASFTLPSAQPADAASYHVVVTNSQGSATSAAATLTVVQPPQITSQPAALTVNQGTSATFTVSATGLGNTFQWRRASTPIPGATSATYTLPSVQPADAASYDVVVTNLAGSATSNAVSLTVIAPPQITQPPASQVVTLGSPATFGVTASGLSLAYQWRKNGQPIPGATGASLAFASVAAGDAGLYDVVVTNPAGSATSASAALTALQSTAIQKANNTTALDQPASWTGGVTPTPLDTALWTGTYTSSAAAANLGTGLSVGRVQLLTPSLPVILNAGTGPLTLGGGGFDLSQVPTASNQNLTVHAPVTLATHQTWTVHSGRTLAVTGAIGDSGAARLLTLAGTGTTTFSGVNTFTGGLVISPPSGGLPTYNFGTNNPAAIARLTGGALPAPIIANGRLDITASVASLGPLSGSGATGLIWSASTSATPQVLTFVGGSSFSMFQVGADHARATLRQTGPGGVTFSFFGYNTAAPNSVHTFDGGTWTLGKIGQNNTNTQTSGTFTLTNGAEVTVQADGDYSNGTWRVIHGALRYNTLINARRGSSVGTNTSLVFEVNNSGGGPGLLTSTGGLTLADGGSMSNANSLTIGDGGTVLLNGALTLGNTIARTAEIDTVTLQSGGKLSLSGTFAAAAATTGQTRTFNWTGGQLTAATITPSAGFATPAAGGVTPTALLQTAGTLAPGDVGTPGRTTINGAYSLGAGATLALDLGGTSAATIFQGTSTQFDNLVVTGATSLAGNLTVSLVNGYLPPASATFTILSSTGTLSGAFANLASGSRLVTTGGEGSFLVSQVGNTVTLSAFLPVVITPFVTPGSGSTLVDWTGSTAVTYHLDRALSPGGPFTRLATALVTTQFTDSTTLPGVQYYYRLTGTDSLGRVTTATSGPPPAAPASLSAAAGFTTVALTWPAVPDATSYRVRRALAESGPFAVFASPASATFTDTGLTTGTPYFYTVTALNASGESAATALASATPIPGTATKTNNATALHLGASWSGGVPPTLLDTAFWNGTYTTGSVSVGSGLSAARLRLTSPTQAITVTAGTGPLTLGTGGIDLATSSQNLTVLAPVVLAENQTWTVNTGRTLTLHGGVTESDPETTLTKAGAGQLALHDATFLWSGSTLVTAGTLHLGPAAVLGPNSTTESGANLSLSAGATLSGTGTIRIPVSIGGTLAPGLSGAGTLTLLNSLDLGASSTTTLNLHRADPAAASSVTGATTLTYGGTLTVTNLGPAPVAGDRFVLFSAARYAGTFATFNLPALPAGLVWDTSGLVVDGTLLVRTTTATSGPRYWDTSATSGLQGGSGAWNVLSAANWNPAADGTGTRTTFWHFDSVFFQNGAANSVTLAAPVGVASLAQSANGTATTLTGGALVLGGPLSNGTPTGNAPLSLQTPVVLNAPAVTITAAQPILLGQGLGGSGTLTKAGASTLTVTGDSTWTGALVLDGGTTRFEGATPGLSALTFGATTAAASSSTLQLTADAELSSLALQNLGTNTLELAPGKTLVVRGPATLGLNGNAAAIASTATTSLAFTGGGSVLIDHPGGDFIVAGGNVGGAVTADFSGLSTLEIEAANLFLGTNLSRTNDTLRLAPASTLTGVNLYVGDANTGGTHALVLGAGPNVLNVNNLFVGQRPNVNNRSDGSVTFPAGATNATLRLRASDGASRANLHLNDHISATGRTLATTFDVAGRSADLLLNQLVIGRRNASASPAQVTNDTFRWDRGTLDVLAQAILSQAPAAAQKLHVGAMVLGSANSTLADTALFRGGLLLAENRSTVTTAGATAQASLTIGGGSITAAGITLGDLVTLTAPTTGTRQSLATLTLTGGTLTLTAPLRSGASVGPGVKTATLTLGGGTLDLGGHPLGGTGPAALTTLNFLSGTLANVASINGIAGLAKTGPGTLTLAGANTFTGPVTVSAGTLALATSATLATSVSVASGATLIPGGSLTGNLSAPAGSAIRIRIDSATTFDRLVLTGATSTATLGATLDLSVAPGVTGGRFRILRNQGNPAAPLSGLFAGLAHRVQFTAAGRTWFLDYGVGSGGDIDLVLLSELELWRQTHFGTLLATGNSADSADPDRDGSPNLLEYALGTSPTSPSSVPKPDVRITNIAPQRLEIEFLRARSDLTYLVEASSTLAPGSWMVIANNPGAVGQSVTVTDSVTINPRRFLRLRVSAP